MAKDGLRGTIGLVTSSLDADYSRRLIAGATEVLTDNGYSPLCFSPGASGTAETQIPLGFLDLIDPRYLSGVIFSPPAILNVDTEDASRGVHAMNSSVPAGYDTDKFRRHIGNLPVVCVGAWLSGVASLWVQNGAGIRLLMKHLTEVCGRRRIAFIRGPEKNVEAEARFRAWQDFCTEYSLPHDDELVGLGDFTAPTGEPAAVQVLEMNAGSPPDAFVVSNDRMAFGVLRALRAKGLSVPSDVSVVGFDDLEAESADPPLTTIRQPIFEMGHRAAEVLVAMLRNESVPQEQMFTPELVIRASCQPNQQISTGSKESSGCGASVFLESAYPSAELLVPLLRKPRHDVQKQPRPQHPLGDQLAVELESGLRRAKIRELDLVASVRSMRARAVEHLDQILSQVTTLRELNAVVLTDMRFLGLDALTLALLCDQTKSKGEARLVVDCIVTDEAPVGPLGERLSGARIISIHAQRTGGRLRVVEPVYHEGEYCGFLVASGTLVDNALLNQLGTVLTSAVMRIGE